MRSLSRFGSAALLCAALAPVPAGAEVIDTGDNGFVVRHIRSVDTGEAEVWRALIHPENWWSADHSWSMDAANFSLDPRAGGCFCEVMPEQSSGMGPGSVEHARVISAIPGRLLRMSGALGPLQAEALTGTITIEIAPGNDGTTQIMWDYAVSGHMRFEQGEIAPAVDGMIGETLGLLVRYVESGG